MKFMFSIFLVKVANYLVASLAVADLLVAMLVRNASSFLNYVFLRMEK